MIGYLISLSVETNSPHRITALGVVDTPPPMQTAPEKNEANSAEKWELPASNTGRRSAALLEAINRLDEDYATNFIKTTFAPAFLNAIPLEEHINQLK